LPGGVAALRPSSRLRRRVDAGADPTDSSRLFGRSPRARRSRAACRLRLRPQVRLDRRAIVAGVLSSFLAAAAVRRGRRPVSTSASSSRIAVVIVGRDGRRPSRSYRNDPGGALDPRARNQLRLHRDRRPPCDHLGSTATRARLPDDSTASPRTAVRLRGRRGPLGVDPSVHVVDPHLHFPGQHGTVERGDTLPKALPKISTTLRQAGYETGRLHRDAWLKRTSPSTTASTLLGSRSPEPRKRLLGSSSEPRPPPPGPGSARPGAFPVASEITARAGKVARERGAKPFFYTSHSWTSRAVNNAVPKYHGTFCAGHRFDVKDHWLESRFRREVPQRREGPGARIELYDEDIAATDERSASSSTPSAHRLSAQTRRSCSSRITARSSTSTASRRNGKQPAPRVLHVPLFVWPAGGGRTGRGLPPGSDPHLFPTLASCGASRPDAVGGDLPRPLPPRSPGAGHGAADREPALRRGRAWSALYAGDDKLIRIRRPASDPTRRRA